MFICVGCIKNYVIVGNISTFMGSFGPCEDCHTSGPCYDVPHNRYYHKDSLFGRKLRFERGEKVILKDDEQLTDFVKNQISECNDVVALRNVLADLLAVSAIYCKDYTVTVDKYRKIY